ncbi:MAG TPA: NACHT domain-containing protein [Blastocatellia bacterium]|nr:NACHT domain-containing protein [Blastocatellia bacterium]
MPFDFDTPKTLFEKTTKAIDWVTEEVIRQRNWRSILALLDVILFLAFNPFQWPFPNLLSLFPQIERFRWFQSGFWLLIIAIFTLAVIAAARTGRKRIERVEFGLSAIRGLLPFGYDDAEMFARLERNQNLQECVQSISDEHWRFGVLTGESGAGKTSFLQAGLWPGIEKRKFRCVYVKFSDLDPIESIKRSFLKHLPAPDQQPNGANGAVVFSDLLGAAEQSDSPVLLIFDQFEQFFVHRKRKNDRAPFVQALARWFNEMQVSPVKILISIRDDFFGRLNELQKAMKYSLGPTQSFRLEKFEPGQAAEILCVLAEQEKIEYDRKFISRIAWEELADAEDGLVSPVDIQVMARMIQRQASREGRAFNQSTFQKLGGVEGLLDRYLTSAVETRETQGRRQAAIKVMLALIDLERNARAGALTLETLREKLGDDLNGSELEETIAWLARSDVRLISPSLENDEEKFELAHERLIPALRRLAGKQLGEADRANQLLDRRANEWLGSGRHSRYLFSRSELRLINRQRRFIAWGKGRQTKEELLGASRRRFRLRLASVGLAVLLAGCGWAVWRSDPWQAYLIKRELRNYSETLNDRDALTEVAKAFLYAGDSDGALQVISRITDDSSKALATQSLAESFLALGDKERARAQILEAARIAARAKSNPYSVDADVYLSIAGTFIKLGDKEQAKTHLSNSLDQESNFLLSDRLKEIIGSFTELAVATKDSSLLSYITGIAERRPGDSDKIDSLGAVVISYAKLGDGEKARSLLLKMRQLVERMNDSVAKLYPAMDVAEYFLKVGEAMKDSSFLPEAIEVTEQISSGVFKADTLIHIAESHAKFHEIEQTKARLSEAARVAEAVDEGEYLNANRDKSSTLRNIAMDLARIGEVANDDAMMSDGVRAAEQISLDSSRSDALSLVALPFARMGNKERANALFSEAIKTAERIKDAKDSANAMRSIAEQVGLAGDKQRATGLLLEAIRSAEQISDKYYQIGALLDIALSFGEIGDKKQARELLLKAIMLLKQGDLKYYDIAHNSIVDALTELFETAPEVIVYEALFNLAESRGRGKNNDKLLDEIFESRLSLKSPLTDLGRLRLLVSQYSSEEGKAKALARILMDHSHPELVVKKNA